MYTYSYLPTPTVVTEVSLPFVGLLIRTISKTDAARITKLYIQMFHDES